MIDNFYTILPGQKLNAVDLAGESRCFDAIFCDGVVSKIAAKSAFGSCRLPAKYQSLLIFVRLKLPKHWRCQVPLSNRQIIESPKK